MTTDRLPRAVRRKEFDYGVYQLTIGQSPSGPFTLDLGVRDDLHVLRFHAKEQVDGRTVRWTQDRSFVALSGLEGGERSVTMVMSDGGRPAGATPARVRVLLDDVLIGETAVGPGFQTYVFPISEALAAKAAASVVPAELRFESTLWRPNEHGRALDTRYLGVLVDSVAVR